MEKTLVLRLLIYGIITQVSDKENACGKGAGAPTSFRRPDGITIVCLPLPSDRATGSTQTTDSSKDANSLSSHGITLRITPNEEKLIISTKANYKEEEEEKKPKSAPFKASKSSEELEYSTTTVPLDLEKPKKGKDSKKAEPDGDKEEEEEEDGDIRNKRKAKEDVKPPAKRKELVERSTVEYETTTSRPAAEEEPEEEEEPEPEKPPEKEKLKAKAKETTEKPKVKSPREAPFEKLGKGGKKQSLSLANLQDLLGGNENDDEVEQYILIRRRKKRPPLSSSSGGESASLASNSKQDLMLPLASSEATTTSSISKRNKHQKDNNKKAIKGSKSVTIELVNETRQRRGLKQRRTKRKERTADDSVPAKTSGKADKGKMTDKGEEGDKRIRRRRRQRGDQLPSRKNEELKEESKPQVTVEASQREPKVDYGQRIKRRKSEVTTDGQTKTKTTKKKTESKRKREQVKQTEESAASETITDAASDTQSSRIQSRKGKSSKSKRNSEDASEQTTTTTTTTTTKRPKRKRKKPKRIEKENDDKPDVKASKPKAKRNSEDNEIEASKREKSGPQWAQLGKHQIFIIHVPITQHNNFSTTLSAPTKETGAKEEEKFSDFLKHFNFSPADGVVHGEEVKRPSPDEDGRDKRESPPKKKKKQQREDEPIQDRDEQYGGVTGKKKKASKAKKSPKKEEAEEAEKPKVVKSKKPDTIGDLWGAKEEKDDGEEVKERPEPEAEKPKGKKRKTSKRKPCDDKEKEAEPETEPEAKGKVRKPSKEDDSVYQLLKVAHISVDGESNGHQSAKKQNDDDDPDDFGSFDFEQAKTWPAKNGHFKEEFNHSFRYDKETGSGHKSFKAFGDKGKVTTETKEDGESPAEEKAKNEDLIWGMIKKMQNVPWFKGDEEIPDNELTSGKKRK